MSRAQNTIIWLGLILIVLNLAVKWKDVKAVVFGGTVTTASKVTLLSKATSSNTGTPVATPANVAVTVS